MNRIALFSGLAGLIIVVVLVLGEGVGEVAHQFTVAGFGLVLVALARLLPLLLSALGWRVLLPSGRRRHIAWLTWVVWVREAVNALLPVLRIGGEVVAVRLLVKDGIKAASAVASLVVDLTLSLFILFAFVGGGVLLLTGAAVETDFVWTFAVGLALSAIVIAAFFVVQRIGLFGLSERMFRLFGNAAWTELAGGARRLDTAIRRLWRLPRRVLISFLWQSLSWLAGVGEMWLTLWVLGQHADWRVAFVLEALVLGVGQAAFMVPGALGVQEGGFMVVGAALGLTPDMALATALVRRARDVLIYGPALVGWSISEGRWLSRRFKR